MRVIRTLLLGLGVTSALPGAAMALLQRHLKRLLAFSTVSHTGVLLIGLALLSPGGASGMLLYMAGHGLVKGALFMVAGILLSACGGIDEIGLRGQGARVWPAGVAMAAGGLLLAGLPAAAALLPPGSAAGPVSTQPAASAALLAWLSVTLALLLAAYQLSRQHLPELLVRSAQRVLDPLSAGLDFLHSGAVGDYIAWVVVGLALFAAAFGLG